MCSSSAKYLLLLSYILSSAGIAHAQREPVITLRRTACYGTCPVYSVEIFEDGRVKFTGKQFVQVSGERTAAIPKEDVGKLVQNFLRIDYFSLKDMYETDGYEVITDLPTTYTSLRIGGRTKSVEDYAFAPEVLNDLEWEIDRTANTHRWIHGGADDLKKGQYVESDVDRRIKPGLTRLMQDAGEGKLEAMEQEREHGGNVNAADETGWTALMLASAMCQDKAVGKLLEWGARVHSRDKNGDSALTGAAAAACPLRSAEEQQTNIIRLLLQHGANPNSSDHKGETPLMAVATYGNVAALRLLLDSGARADLRDRDGKSALDYARQSLKQFNGTIWTDGLQETVRTLQAQ